MPTNAKLQAYSALAMVSVGFPLTVTSMGLVALKKSPERQFGYGTVSFTAQLPLLCNSLFTTGSVTVGQSWCSSLERSWYLEFDGVGLGLCLLHRAASRTGSNSLPTCWFYYLFGAIWLFPEVNPLCQPAEDRNDLSVFSRDIRISWFI